MKATIRLQRFVVFEDPAEDGKRHGCPAADGVAYYEIIVLRPAAPCVEGCGGPSEPHTHHYERQPFSRSGQRHYEGATPTEIANDRANIWAWDGNIEAPTLTPSFAGPETSKDGVVVRPFRVHLVLRAGKIELCSDSTVSL